jgi:renalase
VVLAVPPAQAAVLLAGHHDDWAAALMARRMEPCWTLTAITDDVDWPWDVAVPERGPLARIVRNDRLPGRTCLPGLAAWTAYAGPEWSGSRIDVDAQSVIDELQAALRAQLPFAAHEAYPWKFHYASVQRWRHAAPATDCDEMFAADDALWDESLCIGVCGDWLGGAGVEAAWHSGDELADTMAVAFEAIAERQSQITQEFSRTTATWSQVEASGAIGATENAPH